MPCVLRSTVNRRPPSRTALPTGSSMRSPAPSDRSAPPGSSTTVPFFEARSATQNRPSVTPNSAWVFEMRMLSSVSGTSTAGVRPATSAGVRPATSAGARPRSPLGDAATAVPSSKRSTNAPRRPMARTRRASTPAAAASCRCRRRCRRRRGGEHGRLPLPEPGRHHGGTRPRRRDEGVLVRCTVAGERRQRPRWRRRRARCLPARVPERPCVERVEADPHVERVASADPVEPAAPAPLGIPAGRGEEHRRADERERAPAPPTARARAA